MHRPRKTLDLAERRATAAKMLRDGTKMGEIGLRLGVHRTTVLRDVAALRENATVQAKADLTEVRDLELQKLDRIEQQAAEEFEKTRRAEFLRIEVQVSARRAALLGLDDAERIEISGPNGGPVTVQGHGSHGYGDDSPELKARIRTMLESSMRAYNRSLTEAVDRLASFGVPPSVFTYVLRDMRDDLVSQAYEWEGTPAERARAERERGELVAEFNQLIAQMDRPHADLTRAALPPAPEDGAL